MKNKENLMKHFASVLRNRAMGKEKAPSISNTVARYFSRKELIEIIKTRFGGSIPKGHNLIEMENEELLNLIGDELFIISFMTQKWSKEISFGGESFDNAQEPSPQIDKKETSLVTPKKNINKSTLKDKKEK